MFIELFEKLGDVYAKEKNLIKSKKLYDAYVSLKNKDELEAIMLIGMIFVLLRKYEDAISKFKILVDNDEFYRMDLVKKDVLAEIIGVCYYEIGNMLEATRWFLISISINKNNFNSNYNLANIYILSKKYFDAKEILLKLKEQEPSNIKILNNISSIEKKMAEKIGSY